ncbi:MAG: hypothetical protein U1E84_16510 [Rhodoferax sp.]
MNIFLGGMTIRIHPRSPVFMRIAGVLQGRLLGVVQHDHHSLAARAMPQQFLEEGLERLRIEALAHGADKFAADQAARAEAGHRLAGGRMEQYRIPDLGWHPHPAPGAVLLEVAFVQAPQFNVRTPCQTAQFF